MTRTRHALRFDMIGIPVGATITFAGKPDVECLVVSLNPPKLLYKETVYSMTPLVKEVLEIPDYITPQPGFNLVYEKETLAERRERI